MSTVPLTRQIQSVERLIKLGAGALRKEGVRPSEIDLLLSDAAAAKASLEAIIPVQDGVRELVRAAKRSAT